MSSAYAIASAIARGHSGAGPTAAALALASLAGLLALASAGWALARVYAWEPRWASWMRHSIAEARFRASATWSEFEDWLRLGR